MSSPSSGRPPRWRTCLCPVECISDSARRGPFLFLSYLGRSKDLCAKGTPSGNDLLKPNYILFSLRLLLIILFKTLKVYGFEWLTICDLGMQQYAYFIFRYLIPSHCLDCPKVIEQCPVRGCGQHCRLGEMLEHKKERMERHISLMESERTGILWKSEKVGQTNLNRLFIARKNSVTVDLVSSVKSFEKKKNGQTNVYFSIGYPSFRIRQKCLTYFSLCLESLLG